MNKRRDLLLCAIASAALAISMPAKASSLYKGEMTLGVSGGYASYNNSGYTSVYFHYTFVPHVRIAPEVGYVFRHNNKSALTVTCDMQFPFRLGKAFNVYPLAGLTFNTWNHHNFKNLNRVGGDVGLGFELYITGSLKLNLQGKYSFMKDTSGAFAGLGFGYVF